VGGSIYSQAITGNKRTIEFNISGPNYSILNALADSITRVLQQNPCFTDVVNTVDKGKQEIQIQIDRQKASTMGLNTAMIGIQVRQSIYGTKASGIKEDGDEFAIMVRVNPLFVSEIENIKQLQLTNMFGQQVPLGAVAKVNIGSGSLQIDRFAQERMVRVMAELNVISLGEGVAEAKEILKGISPPLGTELVLAGQTSEQGQSFADLYLIFFLGIALVYMVMAGQFESFKDPFIIMFAIPLTLIGVVWAFKITGITLSVTTFVGVIMLLGIVVNNGIILVDYTNLLRKRDFPLLEAIAEAGRSRLRPVLMTSLTTILGMLPLALSNAMGREAYQPLGITMIGGLLVSTFITLFVVPTMYATLHQRAPKNKSIEL